MDKTKRRLLSKRRRLIKELPKTYQMLSGLYAIYRQCGKPGCKCQGDYRHGPAWCLHYQKEGKTKIIYIPPQYADKVKGQGEDFKRYKKIGEEICRINRELLKRHLKK